MSEGETAHQKSLVCVVPIDRLHRFNRFNRFDRLHHEATEKTQNLTQKLVPTRRKACPEYRGRNDSQCIFYFKSADYNLIVLILKSKWFGKSCRNG